MFFRIAGNTDTKIRGCCILKFFIKKKSFVHLNHLLEQLGSISVTVGFRNKSCFALDGIALQHKDVIHSKEMKIDQRILCLLFAESSTDNVRHCINFIMVLY